MEHTSKTEVRPDDSSAPVILGIQTSEDSAMCGWLARSFHGSVSVWSGGSGLGEPWAIATVSLGGNPLVGDYDYIINGTGTTGAEAIAQLEARVAEFSNAPTFQAALELFQKEQAGFQAQRASEGDA